MTEFLIDEDFNGSRLDRFLRKTYPQVSLAAIQKILRKKQVLVNGSPMAFNGRLCLGDKVTVQAGLEPNAAVTDEKIYSVLNTDINVAYEDEDIIIVRKDHGMAVHKGSGHDAGLTEMLRAKRDNPLISPANRIDRRTGGLVIFGKNRKALRFLNEQMRSGGIEKRYYALAAGTAARPSFRLENRLKRTEKGMAVDEDGKASAAEVKVIRSKKGLSLLEIALETGRTHQIRVQLAAAGLPIIGDGRYGVYEKGIMYLYSYFTRIREKNVVVDTGFPENFLKRFEKGL